EDCARLLQAVDAALPTIVLQATVDGQDVHDVEVTLDGERLERGLDGLAVEVDPGPHVVRFMRSAGVATDSKGGNALDMRFVAREGEKTRPVSGSFRTPAVAIAPLKGEAKGETNEKSRRLPVVPTLLAGTGVLALGGAFLLRNSAEDRAAALHA